MKPGYYKVHRGGYNIQSGDIIYISGTTECIYSRDHKDCDGQIQSEFGEMCFSWEEGKDRERNFEFICELGSQLPNAVATVRHGVKTKNIHTSQIIHKRLIRLRNKPKRMIRINDG